MKIKLLIAFLVVIWCLFASTAYCQDSTHATDSSAQQNILGMPAGVVVVGVVTVLIAVFVYVFVQRRQLKQKDEEIAQKDTELSLKAHELEMKGNELEQDRLDKREAELKAEREKKKHFVTFEERYLDYLYQHHRWLKIQGLKTRAPVSVDLKKVYVPLRAYVPGDNLRDYIGDLDIEQLEELEAGGENVRELRRKQAQESEQRRVDIASILKERKKVVILGGPGCGKTTFLGFLALVFAQKKQKEWLGVDQHRIPICISCRDLNPDDLPTATEIHDWCVPDMLRGDNPEDFFKNNLNGGNCLILLDGLDEVASIEKRRAIVGWVHELANVFHKNQFIITSRIMGYRNVPLEEGFLNYYVSDFDKNDVSNFVKNWYLTVDITLKEDSEHTRENAEIESKDLIDRIFKEDRIRRLASNPLLLSIIATVHRYAGRLPENRALLYNDCVELLLGGKDEALKIPLKVGPAKKLEVLKPLAFHMHDQETRDITRDELAKMIEGKLRSVVGSEVTVDDFIEEVRNRSGLLVERGQGVYSFSHLTFQEYLTALYLKDQSDAVDLLISKKDSAWWREAILLYCGMTDVTLLVKRLLECREDVLLSNLRLAGLFIGDALSIDPELRHTTVERLYDYYWSIDILELREDMLGVLVAVKEDSIIGKFLERLDDDDSSVRSDAASALGQIGVDEAIEKLLACLDDDDRSVRSRAAKALGQIGSEKAAEKLSASLDDDYWQVRTYAADALGHIGCEKAVERVVVRLDDENASVRSRAAAALGWMGREKTVDKLLSLIDDDDSDVRAEAVFALCRIGNETAVEKLMACLGDNDSSVRTSAAYALSVIGSETAVDELLVRLDDDDNKVRSGAAYALGRIGAERVVEKLIAHLDDDAAFVRSSITNALGYIGSKKAVEKLTACLDDGDSDVRFSAAVSLGQIDSEKAAEKFLARLDNRDSSGAYPYFTALYKHLKKEKVYIDELPEEMIQRNHFWKENVKRNAPC